MEKSVKEMAEEKFVKVANYWMGYCIEVKGAKTEQQFVEALEHMCKNYPAIEKAYDIAMEGKVA
jgi:hypothetical protein